MSSLPSVPSSLSAVLPSEWSFHRDEFSYWIQFRILEYWIEGYNITIFAYGQTGSGKTFTIQGPIDMEDVHSDQRGIMPRCFEYIFHNLDSNNEKNTSETLVKCSYLEIYNEKLKDLLDPSSQFLKLREDILKGVYVEGATEKTVSSAKDIMEIIKKGTWNRHISSTDMNHESSRSHAVMSLSISSKKLEEDIYRTTTSSFNIIDLAGSERVKKTNAVGVTLIEAGKINTSLSTLGSVINSLVEIGKGKKQFVRYRDSVLTYLLRNSLGGNAKTLMIANISPSSYSYFETLSTLKFAQRAKMIKNEAIINEDSFANVKQLKLEIQKLKMKISTLEIEKEALKYETTKNPIQFLSPNSIHRSNRKSSNPFRSDKPWYSNMHNNSVAYLDNNQIKEAQFISPSKFSYFGWEEIGTNSSFVKRIKELEDIVKLFTENNLRTAKFYEAEMNDRNRTISILEKQIEEYKIIKSQDEMIISFRDNRITKLTSSTQNSSKDGEDHIISTYKKEIEALQYKLDNNPELTILKEKWSRLERENEQINGKEGKSLEILFREFIGLTESIQQYFSNYHQTTEQEIIEGEKMKRISDISDLYEKEKRDSEENLNNAYAEIRDLRAQIEALQNESNTIKEEYSLICEKEQFTNKRYDQIKDQLDKYKAEMSNFADENENEQKMLRIELINVKNIYEEQKLKFAALNKEKGSVWIIIKILI